MALPDEDERLTAAMAHASVVANVAGLTGLVLAVLLWATQRRRSRFVRAHIVQALVYQIGTLLGVIALMLLWSGCLLLSLLPAALRPDLYRDGTLPDTFWIALFGLILPNRVWVRSHAVRHLRRVSGLSRQPLRLPARRATGAARFAGTAVCNTSLSLLPGNPRTTTPPAWDHPGKRATAHSGGTGKAVPRRYASICGAASRHSRTSIANRKGKGGGAFVRTSSGVEQRNGITSTCSIAVRPITGARRAGGRAPGKRRNHSFACRRYHGYTAPGRARSGRPSGRQPATRRDRSGSAFGSPAR